jgi:competence protein ComEC
MAITSLRPVVTPRPDGPSAVPAQGVFTTSVWQSPLVPIALAGTAGIVLDRYVTVPLLLTLLTATALLVCWAIAARRGRNALSLIFLWAGVVALGAAYHHFCREIYAEDDIGHLATFEPQPVLLRGILEREPTVVYQVKSDPLRSFERLDSTRLVLRAQQLKQGGNWQSVSGLAQITIQGHRSGLHVADEVEVVGRLLAPQGPANPGEFDYASYLQDQRIRAIVAVQKTPDGVKLVAEHWPWTIGGWLAVIRQWGQQTLEQSISPEYSGVAVALLLGEGSTMTGDDWDQYIKTGVIHVLAISGQHLVVLAAFLWLALRLLGVRRRNGACFVALFLLAYALMAGGRPPVLRSAVTVCACCGGLLVRRPVLPSNSFALAWIVIALLNPTDLFTSGCQLSFLSVAILYWGVSHRGRAPVDPLKRLVESSRPAWLRGLRWLGRQVLVCYLITLVIWCGIAPLVASRYNLLSVAGLLIGPPTVLLTSVALIAGFFVLLLTPVCWPLAAVAASITQGSLAGCEALVRWSAAWPFAYTYLSNVPSWWLWPFYIGLLGFLMLEPLRQRWQWGLLGGLAWMCVGLGSAALHRPPLEFRCTFVAVGHGGCTVLELPEGRTCLYDAGAIVGPDVTRRQIAPFLWERGIRRIDEVLLSHADLDHFNGLPSLLERFAVGQVTCTPTFDRKTTPGAKLTLDILKKRNIPVRTVHAGDRLNAGEVQIDVLHPPAAGPDGSENARSMVLLVHHRGYSILLTGDLEAPGLTRVLGLPALAVDILQAPHHGSRVSNKPELAAWARPRVVVSCQEPPRRAGLAQEPYTARGATYLPTWRHGAVALTSQADGLLVETYLTGQRLLVASRERERPEQ